MTHCLEGRFRQGVNLRMPMSEAVRGTRRRPVMTAVSRLFWHGCGTDANILHLARPASWERDDLPDTWTRRPWQQARGLRIVVQRGPGSPNG